jgi:hypothetical protein
MTEEHDHDHKELYFQIRENTKATSELRTQVALVVQAVATMTKNSSSFKSAAITFGFSVLTLAVGGIGTFIIMHLTSQG